jgi:peptidoglycan hydrolase-like protein with peptidoglycan-binding domain
MRIVPVAIGLSVLCAVAGFAAGAVTKATVKHKVVVRKGTGQSKMAPAQSKLAKGKSTRKVTPAATWRTRQQNPTPDRYKEIQQALVDKGYLKGVPTGVWDADSAGAIERFQMDQKLQPTGKINAPSLIGLGLGAKSAGAPEAAPLTPPPETQPEH